MSNINRLKEAGIDTDSIIIRLGGNEELYLSICKKFMNDPNYNLYQSAVSLSDRKSAETYIHTLKGIAANLGFLRLSQLCNSILEDISLKDITGLDKKNQLLSEEYHRIISILVMARES